MTSFSSQSLFVLFALVFILRAQVSSGQLVRLRTKSILDVMRFEDVAKRGGKLHDTSPALYMRNEQAQLACQELDNEDGPGALWTWSQAECAPDGKSYLIQCKKLEDLTDSALIGDLEVFRRYCDTLSENCFEYLHLDQGQSASTAMCVANNQQTHYTTSKFEFVSCSKTVTFEKPRGVKVAKVHLVMEASDLFERVRAVPELFFQDWTLGLPGERLGRTQWTHTVELEHSFSSAQFIVKFCAQNARSRQYLQFVPMKIKGAGVFQSV